MYIDITKRKISKEKNNIILKYHTFLGILILVTDILSFFLENRLCELNSGFLNFCITLSYFLWFIGIIIRIICLKKNLLKF